MGMYGIELEMACYYQKQVQMNAFESNMRLISEHGKIESDGSISVDARRTESGKYAMFSTMEVPTIPFEDKDEMLRKIRKIFFSEGNPYNVSINEDGGDIRIDFNASTGTHIHYSSEMINNRKTKELYMLSDEQILKKMFTEMYKKCEFTNIKKAFTRKQFSKSGFKNVDDRYNAINVSDEKGHGTIEFRLFNLHRVHTKDFISALKHQLDLLDMAIKTGYKEAEKPKINKVFFKRQKQVKKHHVLEV